MISLRLMMYIHFKIRNTMDQLDYQQNTIYYKVQNIFINFQIKFEIKKINFMSQQIKQRFQRAVKKIAQPNKQIKNNLESQQSKVKKSIIQNQLQASPKKSQYSIDQRYQFIIKQKEEIYNEQRITKFVNKINKIIRKNKLKVFFQLKMYKVSKQKHFFIIPFLECYIDSICQRKKYGSLLKLKVNSQLMSKKLFAMKNIIVFYKKKQRENVNKALSFINKKARQRKLQDLNKMNQKLSLSLPKNHSSTQKEAQFQKFSESIENNIRKDKDFQLAKINTVNLIKKFNRQQKFKERIKIYELLNELVTESQKNTAIVKQSNVIFSKIVNFLDPYNPSVSISNAKQMKKQISMLKNKFQTVKNIENSNQKQPNSLIANTSKQEISYFQYFQKASDLITVLFQQLLVKKSEKQKNDKELGYKIGNLQKQLIQIRNKNLDFQQNKGYFQSLLSKFDSLQNLTKQLNQLNKKGGKRKGEFPFSFFSKLNQMIFLPKKNINQASLVLKNIGSLYLKKNLSDQNLSLQKVKIVERYSKNEVFTSIYDQTQQLTQNAVLRERQLIELQMKKLNSQNQKMVKQIQSYKSRTLSLTEQLSLSNSNKTLNPIISKNSQQFQANNNVTINKITSSQASQLNQNNSNSDLLSKSLKVSQNKIQQLSNSIKDFEKIQLQNDLVQTTLMKMIHKINKSDQTWVKDVQTLKKGRNSKKYELIFLISDIFNRLVNQSKQSLKQIQEENKGLHQKIEFLIQDQKQPSQIYRNQQFNKDLQLRPSQPLTERISWDLSQQIQEVQPKFTNSFMIEQNLLEESSILNLKESNLLVQTAKLSPMKRGSLQLQQKPSSQSSSSYPISIGQIQQMNGVLIKVLSQQLTSQELLKNQIIKLKNPYFANLVILLQSFVNNQQLIGNYNKFKQQTSLQHKNLTDFQNSQENLRQFMTSCYQDILKNNFKFEQEYWQKKIEEIHFKKSSLITLQLSNLLKKISSLFFSVISKKFDTQRPLSSNSLQWQKQKQNLTIQISNLQQSLNEMEKKMKETEAKYQTQISYYQRKQQKTARSAYHLQQSVESKRSIRSSRSTKSLKSQSSESKSNNKFDDIKNYYKQSMEEYSKQERKLLQRLESLTTQKQNLQSALQSREYQLRLSDKQILQLKQEVERMQRNQSQIRSKYEEDFDSLRHDLDIVKQQISKEVDKKQQELQYYKEAYEILIKKYKQLQFNKNTNQTQKVLTVQGELLQKQFNEQHQHKLRLIIEQKIKKQFDQRIFTLQSIITNQQQQKVTLKSHYQSQIFNLLQKSTILENHLNQLTLYKQDQQSSNLQIRSQNINFKSQFQKLITINQQLYSKNQSLKFLLQNFKLQIEKLKQQNLFHIQNQQKLQILIKNQIQQKHHYNNLQNRQHISRMNNNTTQNVKQIDQNTYVITTTTTSGGSDVSNVRQIGQVQQLKMRISQMQQQRSRIIQNEIMAALKAQQQEFNQFLQQNNKHIEQHFYNVIIPQKLKTYEFQWITMHPQSEVTQKTNSSISNIPIDFNEEAFVNQKYQQWKNTYLPVILQLKYKQWVEKYESTQLQIILNKKYQEWQQVRLLSIMKQSKNSWILDQLFAQRIKQWEINQENVINMKIKQVNEYWETTVLPLKFKQWETTSVSSSIKLSGIHYSQQDLDRLINQQRQHLIRQFDNQLQIKIYEVQQYWQRQILPKKQHEWQINFKTHQSSSIDNLNIQQIINAKYQEWKHTYLIQYLRIQKQKWLEEFKRTQLQILIKKKYQQWENIRLLAIVKDPRNSWVVQAILKEKLFQWEKQRQEQWVRKIRDIELYWQNTVFAERKKQWETQFILLHPQKTEVIIKESSSNIDINQEIKKHQSVWIHTHQQQLKLKLQELQSHWKAILHDQKQIWQQNLQNALLLRTQQVQNHWNSIILPQMKLQWQNIYIQEHPPVYNKSNEDEQNRIQILVSERIQDWKRVELQKILIQKHRECLDEFMRTQLLIIIKNKESEWLQYYESDFNKRLNSILVQQRHRFEVDLQNSHSQKDQQEITRLAKMITNLQRQNQELLQRYNQLERSRNQNVTSRQALYKLQTENIRQLNEMKLKYEEKLSQLAHEKSLLAMQIKELQINLNKSKPKQLNITSIQTSYDKQLLSLQATIKTKESEIIFLKKSLDSSTLENHQLNARINNLNHKISTLQISIDQTKNISIKFEYQIKYLKEKQSSLTKKLQSKQLQLNQTKSRIEFEKNLLEKKLRQNTFSNQNLSALQIKLSELQSQLSLKLSNIKSLQNEIQRRKRQIQQQKQRSLAFSRDIQSYKSTIKQHQSIVQDLRLQIRKSCDQINRQKLMIDSFEHKERNYIDQLKRTQLKSRDKSDFQEIIRENQRLRVENYRIKQKLLSMQSNQSRQILRLKEVIHHLEVRLRTQVHHYREGDITEIQVLKRINNEISDLVSTNKQLQMRIIVLENEKQLSAFGISIQRFFVAFQQQMDNLINYLISNQIFSTQSLNLYNKFQQKSRQALSHGYVEDYFRQWQAFMRGVIEQNFEEIGKMTVKMNGAGTKRSDDEADEIIEKYDTVLNDVKYVLIQYLKTGQQEYLEMMSKSLGLQGQAYIQKNEVMINGKKVISERNSNENQQQTLTRQ